MRLLLWAIGWGVAASAAVAEEVWREEVLLVRGLDGAEEYQAPFDAEVEAWREAAEEGGRSFILIEPSARQKEMVLKTLKEQDASPVDRLWLVLVGHGTFDGRVARFNLEGPDLDPETLALPLASFPNELVFVHSGSASQPFAQALAAPNRIAVSATKSGGEVFATRFGLPFAQAIGGEEGADLDQDGQVSVLEAFLHAAGVVEDFYRGEERLSTEHALLDDDGDGIGIRSERFEGLTREASDRGGASDGDRAAKTVLVVSEAERRWTREQRAARATLESKIEALKEQREALGDEAFFDAVEPVLRELAELYEAVDPTPVSDPPEPDSPEAETLESEGET